MIFNRRYTCPHCNRVCYSISEFMMHVCPQRDEAYERKYRGVYRKDRI